MAYSTQRIKRVAAVHDISGIGRCALSAIFPTMSALGLQVCAVPTAILSTQTDGFDHFTFRDLTEDIKPIFAHWRTNGVELDCIYTGFLGSEKQVEILREVLDSEVNAFKVVDPVLGDEGALYSTITEDMGSMMKDLCAKADMITPNLTECAYLLGVPYEEREFSVDELHCYLQALCSLGPSIAVLTGVMMADERLMNCAYDRINNTYAEATCERLKKSYPGTGDTFTAVLTGLLLLGYSLERALQLATSYLSTTIALTIQMDTPVREGIAIERTLPMLLELSKQD